MVLPLIPLAFWGATAVLGGTGAVGFAVGASDKSAAKSLIRDFNSRQSSLQNREDRLKEAAARLEERHKSLKSNATTLGNFLKKKADAANTHFAVQYNTNGQITVDATIPHVRLRGFERRTLGKDSANLVTGMAGGVALRHAGLQTVRMTAHASTGTAISTLTGAAGNRAALAAVGGGAKAAGGLGMAGGAAALNGITLGATVAWYGVKYMRKHQEALDDVQRQIAQATPGIEKAEREISSAEKAIAHLQNRANELGKDLSSLNKKLQRLHHETDADKREFLLYTAIEDYMTLCSGIWG